MMISETNNNHLPDKESSQYDCCLQKYARNVEFPPERQYVGESIATNLENQHSGTVFTLLVSFHDKVCNTAKTLKTFIAFLLNGLGSETQNQFIINILNDQIHQYPGCVKSLEIVYETLILTQEEEFKDMNLMNFIVNQLESVLAQRESSSNTNRMTRRKRKKKRLDGEATSSEAEINSVEVTEQKEQTGINHSHITRLLWAVKFCTKILKHDLNGKINRGEHVTNSIIFRLVFKGADGDFLYLNEFFIGGVFEAYKSNALLENRRSIAELLELCAEVCTLVDGVADVCLSQLAAYTQQFRSIFLSSVFPEKLPNEFTYFLVQTLNVNWLKYFAAHCLLEKIYSSSKISPGMRGVWEVLSRIMFSTEQRSNESVLKSMDSNEKNDVNQLHSACRANDLSTLNQIIESNVDLNAVDIHGRSALHIVAKYGSVQCAKLILKKSKKKLKVGIEDNKGMTPLSYAEQSNNSELQHLLSVYTGSSSKTKLNNKFNSMTLKLLTIIVVECVEMSDGFDALRYLKDVINLLDRVKNRGADSIDLMNLSIAARVTKEEFEKLTEGI